MARSALTIVAALAAVLATSQAARADGLVDNVNGMTLDKDGKVVRFQAMLVNAQGAVVRLLSAKDKRPEKLDWRADMKGKYLLPGMIDAHGHVMELGFRALELDLSDTKSLAEAQMKIAAYARDNPDKAWIIGGGWNQETWGLGRFPTTADLDAAVGDRPVWLARADGHAGWGNSAALKAAGVTATADMGTSIDDWLTYRRIADLGGLRVRIMSYGMGVDTTVQIGGTGPTPWLYDDRLKLVGVKLYADGALGSRGAWLKAPYADAPGQTGAGFMNDTVLRNRMSRAAMDGYQVAVHAIGDRANAEVLDAIDEMAQTYKGDRRWRVEHAQIVDPVDLPRFGKYGTIASMQPVHETSDRLMAEARLGPQRLAGAYAWASMLRNGAKLAFGSDYPVEKPDPWAGWAAAFTRQGPDGQPFGGWQPQEAITREQAWWAYTGGAAYAGFAEDRFGRLAPGQKADFVIVDRDPLLASPADLRATKVEQTWIGGQKVWQRK